MDWIQWYFIGLQFFTFGIICYKHGEPKDTNWSIPEYFLGCIFCAPYWGRVLGWW